MRWTSRISKKNIICDNWNQIEYTCDFQLAYLHEHDFKVTFELQNFLNVGPMGCVYMHVCIMALQRIARVIEKSDGTEYSKYK